ncbi:MAG: N-6 DNA methylase [Moorea sp. SIO2B7]|nr:N-6 DNA methylase [Moorena sp. SIO2B7]
MEQQLSLPLFDFSSAVRSFAAKSSEERGAIFTRREVVEFILDLTGYTVDRPLPDYRILEPSIGEGDFLVPIVERLLTAYGAHDSNQVRLVDSLHNSIRAVEINPQSFENTRIKLLRLLQHHGINQDDAYQLLTSWLIEGDFLLVDLPGSFTHAVGNPPYVRQELIPDILLAEYRARYNTIYDRADLYVPFIERALSSLEPGGVLGFICANQWLKNKYGKLLRAMVSDHYHLAYYIDMVDTQAFRTEVSAYPAITVIKFQKSEVVRVAHRPLVEYNTLKKLAQNFCADSISPESGIIELRGVTNGSKPWILDSVKELMVVRRLEEDFPSLEDVGCKVGIGVATGADKVYIGPFEKLEVEPDRKLPLVKTQDIKTGIIKWGGLGVINPFHDNGSLVELENYPKLASYLAQHSDTILKRNCAKKNPKNWYRTIDRIYPSLTAYPKLLIPDIKSKAHIVYEDGKLYPHHNLYFITSQEWDLKALQTVLKSGIAKLFVSIYSTQLRGGYLRFQAQYLRRIRLPQWQSISENLQRMLIEAANTGDLNLGNYAVSEIYGLTPKERAVIRDNQI